MKISINLATQPFRRDRPVIILSTLIGLALAALLAVLISVDVMDRHQQKDTRGDLARLRAQIGAVSGEQARLDAVLRRPENAEVLERSLFLNELLLRKGISWTRILEDLEKVLPYNVRVLSIRPTLNAQNQVALDMQVGSEGPEPVINFLKALEASPLFGAVYQHNSMPPSQSDPQWKYRVSVNYAQKL
jgi:type IV pilus assembly protein PilN